jgi:hypothetical protein
VSEVGRRNRRRNGAAASLGKYYPSSAHSDAFADTNCGAIANIDIFTGADRSAAGVARSDVRVSDIERDAGQVIRLRRVRSVRVPAYCVAAPLGFEPRKKASLHAVQLN